MLLSDFAASDLSEGLGLVIDGPDYMPRVGIERVSLVAIARDGELDQDLLDTTIAYKTAGIDVALDIPSDLDIPAEALIAIAMPLNVDIRLIRAVTDGARHLEAVEAMAATLPSHPGYARTVSPVSEALALMIRERLVERYEGDTPVAAEVPDVAPEIVAAVRRGFSSALGGDEAFGEYIDLHVAAIYEDGRRRIENYVNSVSSPAA